MATIFRIVQKGSESTVLQDLNALESGSTGFELLNQADFAGLSRDVTLLTQRPFSGAAAGSPQDEVVEMSLRLKATHTSLANLRTLLRDLAKYLGQEQTIEYRENGGAASVFIDYYPSDAPALFSGNGLEHLALGSTFTALPVLRIRRHPYLRVSTVSGAQMTITNAVGAREVTGLINNPGNVPALTKINIVPTAASSVTLATSAAADDIIDTATAHSFAVGDRVVFSGLTGGTGLSNGVTYYVISANLAATTFQVSTSQGGSAVNFTTDITAGTVGKPTQIGMVRMAMRSKGDLTEWGTSYGFECESATAGTDTSSGTSAAGYSGSGAMQTTFATTAHVRRWKRTLTLTAATTLEGTHRAYLRLKPYGGATRGKMRVQLRYGFFDSDPITFSNEVVELDFSDLDNIDWTEVDLGMVAVPKGSKTVILELWASRVSGDDNLATDMFHLYPADESFTTAAVPGVRLGAWGKEKWKGEDLDTSGGADIRGDNARVNANGEIVATPPTAGMSLAAGVHRFEVDCTVYIDDSNKSSQTKVGEFQIRDVTTPATVKTVALNSKKNRNHVRRTKTITITVTSADVAASKKYIARVEHTGSTQTGRKILVHRIKHTFLNAITSDDTLVIDGLTRQAYVKKTSTGVTMFPVTVEGTPFPEAPPGNSQWVFYFGDIPTDPGYEDCDYREPLSRSVKDRSAAVTIDTVPRYSL